MSRVYTEADVSLRAHVYTDAMECSVVGCASDYRMRKGYCNKHYLRVMKHGDPSHEKWPPLAERFWSKVDRSRGADACWIWQGSTSPSRNGNRYGQIWLNGSMQMAHRVAYELGRGPIPPGLHIDHVRSRGCTDTLCVNPSHLEAVTQRENVMRGDGITSANVQKTHCPHGHPYSGDNLGVSKSRETGATHRYCKTCYRENKRRYRAVARGTS